MIAREEKSQVNKISSIRFLPFSSGCDGVANIVTRRKPLKVRPCLCIASPWVHRTMFWDYQDTTSLFLSLFDIFTGTPLCAMWRRMVSTIYTCGRINKWAKAKHGYVPQFFFFFLCSWQFCVWLCLGTYATNFSFFRPSNFGYFGPLHIAL